MSAMMFWYGAGGWAWWQGALMVAAMLVFWGLLVWAIHALATGGGRNGSQHSPGEPRRILELRLARGEIDAEEFARVKDLLAAGAASDSGGVTGRT
jgi:putative membrane protein